MSVPEFVVAWTAVGAGIMVVLGGRPQDVGEVFLFLIASMLWPATLAIYFGATRFDRR